MGKSIKTDHCMGCMAVLSNGEKICPICGFDNTNQQENANHLPYTVLNGKYLVGRVLGQGGFGITYIGFDLNLQLKVAIKEFFPKDFASRTANSERSVVPNTNWDMAFFEQEREKFIKEAQLLAKLDNCDSIVHVRDYFLAHGTAYIVMDFVDGITLQEEVRKFGGKMSFADVFTLLSPLLQQLDYVHKQGIIHRDISPDNIIITKDNRPVLLDFGAARTYQKNGGEKTYTVHLKHGYAPLEQYSGKSAQGPFTDVYAICATIYTCVCGQKPPNAIDISLAQECLIAPSRQGATITPEQEKALLKGMASEGQDRYPSMQALYGALAQATPVTAPKITVSRKKTLLAGAIAGIIVLFIGIGSLINLAVQPKKQSDPAFGVTNTAAPDHKTPEECYALGNQYYNGKGVEQNYQTAVEWFRRAAEQDHAKAQYYLGFCYYMGYGTTVDYAAAYQWYRKAADQNDAGGQWGVGVCYYNGYGITQDYAEAVKWFKSSAEQHNPGGQTWLGTCYYKGNGIKQNYMEAVKWYRLAAQRGYSNAQYSLGLCYEKGLGVEPNHTEATKWYELAAEQGHENAQKALKRLKSAALAATSVVTDTPASTPVPTNSPVPAHSPTPKVNNTQSNNKTPEECYALGNQYYAGKGVEQNYQEAVKWYRLAAEQGLAASQNDLGFCYKKGHGVIQSDIEAVKWYQLAANQGNAAAQSNLGACYYYGNGVTQDYTEAVKWYQLAANQGNAIAQSSLGICYYYGNGVTQDYAEAVKWYRLAAEQGLAAGQYNLGLCYEQGLGVSKDMKEALTWYEMSAAQGYQKAVDKVKALSSSANANIK